MSGVSGKNGSRSNSRRANNKKSSQKNHAEGYADRQARKIGVSQKRKARIAALTRVP